MPAYMSHAMMAEKVFETYNKNNCFPIPINISTLKTFSLGVDLTSKNSKDSELIHNKDTGLLLLIMINYILEHSLYENEKVMAFLYGHIAHYYLDLNVHPYIYYMEQGMEQVGILKPHTFFEGVIDSALSEELLGIELYKLDGNQYCLDDNIDTILQEMIDYSYNKLYNLKKISGSYNFILHILKKLETSLKVFHSKISIKKFFLVNQYLRKNNLNKDKIMNSNSDVWYHPVTGNECTESVQELFNRAVIQTCEAIEIVNKVIYDGKSIDSLISLFPDISYDTGIPCNKGKKLKYHYKKHQNQ